MRKRKASNSDSDDVAGGNQCELQDDVPLAISRRGKMVKLLRISSSEKFIFAKRIGKKHTGDFELQNTLEHTNRKKKDRKDSKDSKSDKNYFLPSETRILLERGIFEIVRH